jgi:hypothetical protein
MHVTKDFAYFETNVAYFKSHLRILHILKVRLHILKLPLASFCLITSPAPLSSNLPMKWGKNAYPPKFLNGVSVDEICEVNCQ